MGLRQLCTFYVDGLRVGVDVRQVQEVVRSQALTLVPLSPRSVHGLMNLRGDIVTAVDVRCRLELSERPVDHTPMSVVLTREHGAVSLLVDQVGDVLDLDDDAFEPPPETLRGAGGRLILGAYKLPDGLLLVLDVKEAVRLDADPLEGPAPAGDAPTFGSG